MMTWLFGRTEEAATYQDSDPEYCECGAHIKGTPCYNFVCQIDESAGMRDEANIT